MLGGISLNPSGLLKTQLFGMLLRGDGESSTWEYQSYHEKLPSKVTPVTPVALNPPFCVPGFPSDVAEAGAALFDSSWRGAEQPKPQPGDIADGGRPARSRRGRGCTDRSRRSPIPLGT